MRLKMGHALARRPVAQEDKGKSKSKDGINDTSLR